MFSGRVAFVTGAFGGIGKALSQVLAANALRAITLVDVKEDTEYINDLQTQYKDTEVHFVKCDVTNCRDHNNAYQEAVNKFNQLDIVFNNAGVFDEINPDRQLQINLNSVMVGTVLAMEKYIPKNKSGGDGVIMNVCSVAGLLPIEYAPYYSISKQGVLSIGRTLGSDHNYKRTGVRIITMCPGFTQTPMFQETHSIPKHYECISIDFDGAYKQCPCHLATEMARIVCHAKNGTVWVVEKDKSGYQVELNPICKNFTFTPN